MYFGGGGGGGGGGGSGPLVPPLNSDMQYLDLLDALLKQVINFEPECPYMYIHEVWENNHRGLIRIQIVCHF